MYTISKAPHLILRAPRGHLFCRTTTFSWCNNTIAREKCCLYPPADLPRGKTFFPSERRESNSFHYRNHATHRIRDWIHEMHFQLFWRRIHFNNLNIIQIPVCFAFSFHFLHLFFRKADTFLPQNSVEDTAFASVDRPCLFVPKPPSPFSLTLTWNF